jgi:ParB/RepB/Spo0J family partition protein
MTQQLEFVSSVELPTESITPSKLNPRTEFDRSELEKFAQNIKERGIIHPITVRPIGENDYEIADGERRWLAAKQLGMKHVPVIIRDLTDQDVIELNLIENIQRRDLTDVEKGRAIRSMLLDEKFQYNTQKDLARAIGVSPVEVNRWVALATRLDPIVQEMIAPSDMSKVKPAGTIESRTGTIIASHVKEPERQREIARAIVDSGLRGQEARSFVRRAARPEVTVQETVDAIIEKVKEPRVQIAFTRKEQNQINSMSKRTTILPHIRPGLSEGGLIDICVQTDSVRISGIYKKRYESLTDEDANREGFSNIDEFKSHFEARHGPIQDDESVFVVQFAPIG